MKGYCVTIEISGAGARQLEALRAQREGESELSALRKRVAELEESLDAFKAGLAECVRLRAALQEIVERQGEKAYSIAATALEGR